MAHDVFISHSNRDKPVADAVCSALENSGIRCWVAPRDVQPGRTFAGEITRAIQRSKAMVLIFSANSNNSSQVLREVQLAVEAQLHILQFRIEDVLLNDDLKYFLSTPHWLDAMTPPLENHLGRLAGSLKTLLGKTGSEETSAVVSQKPAEHASSSPPIVRPPPAPQRNRWTPVLLVAAALLAVALAVVLLRQRQPIQTDVRPKPVATPATTTSPADLSSPGGPPTQAFPIQSSKKSKVFSDNFGTTSSIVRPLFGANVMTVVNANGEGEITGKAPGVLPALYDELLLDDFIVESGMRAETVPPGARYGFIFRAADVVNGGIAKYYALLLDPNQNVAVMNCWMDGRWATNREQSIPAGYLKVGRKSRIALEALGNQFRVFINDRFATEFSVDDLKKGRIGLVLSGTDSSPWTVHFDNLQVFLPSAKDTAAANSSSSPVASPVTNSKTFQQSWDFSAGMLRDVRTEAVEIVDASIWKMPGGKHLRFLTGGRSFLEATFDVPDTADPPTRLSVRHLSSSPDGKQLGFSPVRITLNGAEIFRGSPSQPGWMDSQYDLNGHVQPGRNTLLFEYLDGAQTHYWLKSFSVGGSNP